MNISKTLIVCVGAASLSVSLIACDDGSDHASAGTEAVGARLEAVGLGDGQRYISARIEVGEPATPSAAPSLEIAATTNAEPHAKPATKKAKDEDLRKWLRWSGALPYYAGPIFDETGAQCADGQSGGTWYLAGTSGGPVTRSCTIPANKQLVVPLVNYWTALGYEDQADNDDLAAHVASVSEWLVANTCSLTLRLDGVDLHAADELEDLYLSVLEPFDVDLFDGADNWADYFGLVGGTVPAIGTGYYAKLASLSPGDHVLEFGGVICEGDYIIFETLATYELHVGP